MAHEIFTRNLRGGGGGGVDRQSSDTVYYITSSDCNVFGQLNVKWGKLQECLELAARHNYMSRGDAPFRWHQTISRPGWTALSTGYVGSIVIWRVFFIQPALLSALPSLRYAHVYRRACRVSCS